MIVTKMHSSFDIIPENNFSYFYEPLQYIALEPTSFVAA